MFKPYQSRNYLLKSLKVGQQSALAFADLVSFENALRADRRLRQEDKLRRWKARIQWQEMNERERRLRYFRMTEVERRMLGLGISSFFGRRYSAPLLMNGTRGLPAPRTGLPQLRHNLPTSLRSRFGSILSRQPGMGMATGYRQPGLASQYYAGRAAGQSNLSTGPLSRSLVGQDRARNLANRYL